MVSLGEGCRIASPHGQTAEILLRARHGTTSRRGSRGNEEDSSERKAERGDRRGPAGRRRATGRAGNPLQGCSETDERSRRAREGRERLPDRPEANRRRLRAKGGGDPAGEVARPPLDSRRTRWPTGWF